MIRLATASDIPAVAAIYDAITTMEAEGKIKIGWEKGVYPVEQTARDSLEKGHLFVMEEEGRIVATGRINQEQQPEYALCDWLDKSPDENVMVLHTLCVDPAAERRGCAKRFVAFYEDYARQHGCSCLRIDTNECNSRARSMYKKLGFRESGSAVCLFNGMVGVKLIFLEKTI